MFGKSLKIKEFKHAQSLHKACTKTCTINQTVENQALERFLCAYCAFCQKHPFRPIPTDQSVSWHDFCTEKFVFSIYISICTICTIKTTKPLKIKGLVHCANLCASFVHALCKLALFKKVCYNKTPP